MALRQGLAAILVSNQEAPRDIQLLNEALEKGWPALMEKLVKALE